MRRVIAALVGVILATMGVFMVLTYASHADERAAADLQTQGVLVSVEPISVGTAVADFGERVEIRQIPGTAVVDGAVRDLADIESLVLTTETVAGEQLTRSRFATEEELRARGEFELPAELADHHQVTLLLEKTRALGGNIAPGDQVGVFMSFDVRTEEDDEDEPSPDDGPEGPGERIVAGNSQVNITDLALHKVPVVRVEGAFVEPPVRPGEDDEGDAKAEDRIFVTLALEPSDAAKLVFASEWGSVWLSLEPEGASEDDVPTIVVTLPARGEDVLR